MTLIWTTIKRDSVSLFEFPLLCSDYIISCAISLVCLLKYPHSRSFYCFLSPKDISLVVGWCNQSFFLYFLYISDLLYQHNPQWRRVFLLFLIHIGYLISHVISFFAFCPIYLSFPLIHLKKGSRKMTRYLFLWLDFCCWVWFLSLLILLKYSIRIFIFILRLFPFLILANICDFLFFQAFWWILD